MCAATYDPDHNAARRGGQESREERKEDRRRDKDKRTNGPPRNEKPQEKKQTKRTDPKIQRTTKAPRTTQHTCKKEKKTWLVTYNKTNTAHIIIKKGACAGLDSLRREWGERREEGPSA